jgi:hypothetical protein
LEDSLPYDEPWGWMVPSRHALAALLCDAADAAVAGAAVAGATVADAASTAAAAALLLAEAEAVCRADLAKRPRNVWALRGLARAIQTQVRPRCSCFREGSYNLAHATTAPTS